MADVDARWEIDAYGAWIGRHVSTVRRVGDEWLWTVRFNLDERPAESGYENTPEAAQQAAEDVAGKWP